MKSTVPGPESITVTNARCSSEPFIIHLKGEPYILSLEDLTAQVDMRLKRSRKWYYPNIKVVSFFESTLQLCLDHNGSKQQMTVKIEPHKLQVSCNCGTEVETICLHVYKALDRLIGYCRTAYFEKYRPGGTVETAIKYPKYFDREVTATGISYTPKPQLESVYRITMPAPSIPEYILAYPSSDPASAHSYTTEACFIILNSYRSEWFPAIIPCSGALNKAGDGLKSFYNFLSGFEKQNTYLLTGDQQRLSRMGLEMWKLSEQLPDMFQVEGAGQRKMLSDLFQLWQQAFPLLYQQKFVYSYHLKRKRDLKKKPGKSELFPVKPSKVSPILEFVLQDKGDYYVFYPVLVIRDVTYYSFRYQMKFFVAIGDELFLMTSLRDAAILDWIDKLHGRITVFKEHFVEFDSRVLKPLGESYRIERSSK